MRLLLALAILALSPGLAFAHTGIAHGAGFFPGIAHPVGGLDHVLAMLAVGVFAFVLGGRALWLVPLSFVGAMVAGFGLGIAQVQLPFVELAIALSIVAIGGAAALGRPMPVGAAMALVGTFAVFHGHAHGAEMAESADGLTYALGFVTATACSTSPALLPLSALHTSPGASAAPRRDWQAAPSPLPASASWRAGSSPHRAGGGPPSPTHRFHCAKGLSGPAVTGYWLACRSPTERV